MSGESVTRRVYMAAVLGSVGLAGCSLSPGDSGQPGSRSKLSFPSLAADEPRFRNWVPGTGDLRDSIDVAINVARLREQKPELPAETYESLAGLVVAYAGMEFEEIDGILVAYEPGLFVYTGSVSPQTVRARLEPTRFEQFAQRHSITYYRESDTDEPDLIAVGDEGVVYGFSEPDADTVGQPFIEHTTALFETVRGERPRLHEQSELYETYTDSVGWPLYTYSRLPKLRDPDRLVIPGIVPADEYLPDEVVASIRAGYARYLADDAVVTLRWLRVDSGTDVTPAEISDAYRTWWIRNQFGMDDRIAVRADGAVVKVAIMSPLEAVGEGTDPPVASIDLSVDGETAVIEHVTGDPVDLERLTVRVDSDSIDLGPGTLTQGDSLRVDVGDTEDVAVVYEFPTGRSTQLVAADSG